MDSLTLPEPKKVGTNKKAGTCCYCGHRVEAGAGDLFRGLHSWLVYHRQLPEDCEAKGYVRVQER